MGIHLVARPMPFEWTMSCEVVIQQAVHVLAEQICSMSCATSLVQHEIWPASDIQADPLASIQCTMCVHTG